MKKKKKKVITLLGLAIFFLLLCVVLLWVKNSNGTGDVSEDNSEEENSEADVILSWNEEKSRKISLILTTGEKISFKQEEEWKIEGREEFPVIQEEITSMFEKFEALEAERTIENVENLAEFGLDQPVNVIAIETEDGEQQSISIGSYNTSLGCAYVYLNDDTDTVYTVARHLENLFKKDLYEFVQSETYPEFVNDNVIKVEIVKEENSFTLIRDESQTTRWVVEDETHGTMLGDEENGENLASMVQVLSYSKYYEYGCDDFAKYGLDDPLMEIRVEYWDTVEIEEDESADEAGEESDDAELENEEESDASEDETKKQTVKASFVLYVGDYDEEGYYYVRLNDSSEVHGIAESNVQKLLGENAMSYWSLNLGEIALDDLDYLEVDYEGKTYELKMVTTEEIVEDESETETADSDGEESEESEESSDETETSTVRYIKTYYIDGEEVDEDPFREFYRNALAIRCQERKLSLDITGEADLILRFYGKDGSKVIVSYTPYDANFYAVKSNEEYGLVNKMNIKDLIELFVNLVQ